MNPDPIAETVPSVEASTTSTLLSRDVIHPAAQAAPLTATSTGKTSPIARAIRSEILILVEAKVLELGILEAVIKVAESGRALVAVRNPTMRFDAKAQGLDERRGRYRGCREDDQDKDGYDYWNGPMAVRNRERRKQEILDALRTSPLAQAVKAELIELASTEPFGPSELLQIEQLGRHAHDVLSAALGLSPASRDPRMSVRGPMMTGMQMIPNPIQGYPDASQLGEVSSSPETFGAKMSREIISAIGKKNTDPERLVLAIASARKNGLEDVSRKLEAQLGIESTPAPLEGKEA